MLYDGPAQASKDPEIVRITAELSNAIHHLGETLSPMVLSAPPSLTKDPERQLPPALSELQLQVDRLKQLADSVVI